MPPVVEEVENAVDPAVFGIVVVALLFFVITYSVGKNLSAYNVTKRRVRELKDKREELKGNIGDSKRKPRNGKKKEEKEENIEFIKKVVQKLNLLQESKTKELNEFMVSAGYRSKHAAIKFAFAQGVLALGFMVFSLIFVDFDMSHLTPKGAIKLLIPFLAVYVGAWLPKVLVVNAKTKRYAEIQKGLPDALDLMMICTEAGLTLSAALERVSKEIGKAYPTLAEEITYTSIEIGFLPDRKTALEHLATRVQLPEIRALVSILIQTEKYGTPISQALRVLSKEFRTQRMLRAEQKAARLPAIMTVPMIVFILPTMFIIVISPAVIGIMSQGN